MSKFSNRAGPPRWHWTVGRAPMLGEETVSTKPAFRNAGGIKTSEYRAGANALLYRPSRSTSTLFLQSVRDCDPDCLRGKSRPWSIPTEHLLARLGMMERSNDVLHDLHYLSTYLNLYWTFNSGNAVQDGSSSCPWLTIPRSERRGGDAALAVAILGMLQWIQSHPHTRSLGTVMARAADRIQLLSALCCFFAQEAAQLISMSRLSKILNIAAAYYQAGGDRVADVDYLSPLRQMDGGRTVRLSFAVELAMSLHLAEAGTHVTTLPSTDPGAGEMVASRRCDYLLDGQDLAEVKLLMHPAPASWSRAIGKGAQQLQVTTAELGPIGPTGKPRQRLLILCHLAETTELLSNQLRATVTIDPSFGRDYDRAFTAHVRRTRHAVALDPLVEVLPDEA